MKQQFVKVNGSERVFVSKRLCVVCVPRSRGERVSLKKRMGVKRWFFRRSVSTGLCEWS